MPRYALLVEYDGTPFCGWQRQAHGRPTVQAALEAALARLQPDVPSIAAAGRTDSGVHATGQVAHCDLARDWPPDRLIAALNAHLRPAPVAVVAAAPVTEDFHARFSALGRAYRYTIMARSAPATIGRQAVWQVRRPLDLAAMQAGARHLLGRHDFTTFRAAQCQAASAIKTLDRLDISATDIPRGRLYHFDVGARSFLHNQVRSFVGTLERVGAGAWAPDDVHRALVACDRSACGPIAPPQGLCLTRVDYPFDPFAGPASDPPSSSPSSSPSPACSDPASIAR